MISAKSVYPGSIISRRFLLGRGASSVGGASQVEYFAPPREHQQGSEGSAPIGVQPAEPMAGVRGKFEKIG